MEQNIFLRPVSAEDTEFLFKVYVNSRPDFEWLEDTGAEMKGQLAWQQFISEEKYFQQYYPGTEYDIVLFNEEEIGRLNVYRGEVFWRILAFALLPEFRNKGIGSTLLFSVLNEASIAGMKVYLQVFWYNRSARNLYERFGFHVIKDTGPYCEMIWEKIR